MSTVSYDATFVQSKGFGQSPENPAPSLFLQSIAIDKDCSVYGSLFVTNNGTFGKDVTIEGKITILGNATIQGNLNMGGAITAAGSISSGGNGNFSGVVAAAGGFASGNPMKLPGASIGGALNKLTGAMDLGGVLKAASGIISEGQIAGPLMQVAEKFVIGEQPGTEQTGEPKEPAKFYLNQQQFTPQEIFDSRSGEYYTVLAAVQNPSS
jgi:hypothetical protein